MSAKPNDERLRAMGDKLTDDPEANKSNILWSLAAGVLGFYFLTGPLQALLDIGIVVRPKSFVGWLGAWTWGLGLGGFLLHLSVSLARKSRIQTWSEGNHEGEPPPEIRLYGWLVITAVVAFLAPIVAITRNPGRDDWWQMLLFGFGVALFSILRFRHLRRQCVSNMRDETE